MVDQRNQHPGRCDACGGTVAAGQGRIERVEQTDGGYRWRLEHDACPEPGAGPGPEVPRWAVPAEGRTPGGNRASGVALVDGARPSGAWPANDAARGRGR